MPLHRGEPKVLGLPVCPELVAHAKSMPGRSLEALVTRTRKTSHWRQQYHAVKEIFEKEPPTAEAIRCLSVDEKQILRPPCARRQKGKPVENKRIKSAIEKSRLGVGRTHTCGKCGAVGHNRRNCKGRNI